MTEILYPEYRRQEILNLANQSGQVTVVELSNRFQVSEVTIRADLQVLSEKGLLVRTHGGAVSASSIPELSLTLRRQKQVAEKLSIGMAAADLVENGEAIFLDMSSTALALSKYLKEHRNLTVITNSLPIAHELLDAPSVTVVLPGGILQRDTVSLVSSEGLGWIGKYNVQKGFFGAHGFSFPEGLTDVSLYEAEVKGIMVRRCKEVIALIDATKWGRAGLASFARPDEVDRIITDEKAEAALVSEAVKAGIIVKQV